MVLYILRNNILLLFISSPLTAQSVAQRYGDRIELLGIAFKDPLVLCQIFIAIFISIAFMQSGLDKIQDRKGNIEFFRLHFKNTLLNKFSSQLLTILTFLELLAGLVLLYGIYFSFTEKITIWIFYGLVLAAFNFLALFAGQRIAKDYLGAANIVPYFILIMLGIMSMY